MSPRNELRFLTLAVLALITSPAFSATPCTAQAQTKKVYVVFDGCALAQPGPSFDVMIGDDVITVTKEKATDTYWVGETPGYFAVHNATLALATDALPRARATCLTKAKPHRDGACVALFRVSCEPLWQLKVETVPGNARATIQYERKESKVRDCPLTASDRRDPDGPGQLVLSRSESLLVRVGKTSAEVEIPLTFDSFRFGRTELRIRDVQVNRLSVKAAIASSDALAAMGKSALQKIVTDMRFTKDFSPDREK